jgi:antitoxin component YwqK of YwqJK toxin-antitoxin module
MKNTRNNWAISIILLLIILFSIKYNINKKKSLNSNNNIFIERTFYPSGIIKSVISFENNKKQGYFAYFNEDGTLFLDGILINNKFNGASITYINSKKYREENLIDDIRNGTIIYYYQNGNIRQIGNYINGKLENLYKYYTEDGKLAKVKEYKNDTIVKEIVYIQDFDEDDWFDIDGEI